MIDKLVVELATPEPTGVDLGFCTTHQTSAMTFVMHNTGEVDAPYRWEDAAPFVLEPASGVIPAKRSQVVTVSLFPLDASVFVSQVRTNATHLGPPYRPHVGPPRATCQPLEGLY
jgi:hypothetical protein